MSDTLKTAAQRMPAAIRLAFYLDSTVAKISSIETSNEIKQSKLTPITV